MAAVASGGMSCEDSGWQPHLWPAKGSPVHRHRKGANAKGYVAAPRRLAPHSTVPVVGGLSEGTQPGGGQDLLDKERIEELTSNLEAGGNLALGVFRHINGHVKQLSFSADGCHLVQLALQEAGLRDATCLADALRTHVVAAIDSPNANYVVQKIVEVLPVPRALFVAEELRGRGGRTARHQYGCRVLCRLVEHHSCGDEKWGPTKDLLDEVLVEAADLCRHPYGHYVIESALEHGSCEHKHVIAEALQGHLVWHARDRSGCHVVEKALLFCSPEDQQTLASELLINPQTVPTLAEDRHGLYAVSAVMKLPGRHRQVLRHLQSAMAQLHGSQLGRRALREFRLADVNSIDVSEE